MILDVNTSSLFLMHVSKVPSHSYGLLVVNQQPLSNLREHNQSFSSPSFNIILILAFEDKAGVLEIRKENRIGCKVETFYSFDQKLQLCFKYAGFFLPQLSMEGVWGL